MIDTRAPTDRLRPSPLVRWPGAPVAPTSPVASSEASLLEGLDARQRRAVTHGEGPLLVVAGPGTGKTHVITRRIAWLIATRRARPSEILALTFTDKAAEEMQARVDLLVPYGYADTAIHTFHAFGDRLIRETCYELGLSSELRVLSRAEAVVFLRERLFELGLDHYRPLGDPTKFLASLVDLFARAKDEDVLPDAFARLAVERHAAAVAAEGTEAPADADVASILREEAVRTAELARAYARYQELMAAAGCIDFGDQVSLSLRALREHPAVRAAVQRRYRYILVDEFQDTNPAQLELVRLIAGERANVTVVGDDDQSIYTFRGAALDNMLGLDARFPGLRRVVLRRNHRSRRPILDAAYRLIRHNDPARLETRCGIDKKQTAVRRGRAMPVAHKVFRTTDEESDWVAREIAARVVRGADASRIAILVRANADAEPFLRALDVERLPWRFSGASGLYARPVVRELLAFLRTVANPDSSVDLYALATSEPYGLGGSELSSVLEWGRRRSRSLWASLHALAAQPGLLRLSASTRQAAAQLVADVEAACALSHQRPTTEVLYDHLKRSGRLARLAADGGPTAELTMREIGRLFDIVRRHCGLLAEDRVPFLVRHLDTLIGAGDEGSAGDLDEDQEGVAVLTVHKAKGLEFDTVFLVGLVDGRFPGRGRRDLLELPAELLTSRRGEVDEAPYAEERRLAYVAMTRARDELVLTYAAESRAGRARRASPFIAEALDLPRVADLRSRARRDPLAAAAAAAEAPPSVVAAPRAGGDERLSLSFSQLDDYLACPARFRFRHVLGIPVPPHHALAYGSALHAAVAAYHRREAAGSRMSVDELLGAFAAAWTNEGFLSRQHEEARFEAGQDALRRFHTQRVAVDGAAPVAVEQEFAFVLDGDRIRGRYDRVDHDADGAVITDYKSSDVRDPAKARQKAKDSLQLQIYALAHEAQTGTLPAAVQLHFLDSGMVGRVPVDAARLDKARERIRGAAAGMRRREFPAKPDLIGCRYCPFRDICPSSAA